MKKLIILGLVLLSFNTIADERKYQGCLKIVDVKVSLHEAKRKYGITAEEAIEELFNREVLPEQQVIDLTLKIYKEVFSVEVTDLGKFKKEEVKKCYDKYQRKFDI